MLSYTKIKYLKKIKDKFTNLFQNLDQSPYIYMSEFGLTIELELKS